MEDSSGSIAVLVLIAFIWLLPFFSIIFSRKTSAGEKFAWILAVLFISWFAWIFYLLIAPIKKRG